MKLNRLCVSVIVLTHDRPTLLQQSLHSLVHQDQPPDEVIVVDSSRHTRRQTDHVIKSFTHSLPIQKRYTAGSIAYSRWLGAKAAHHPLVIYLDDDCQAAPNYLALFLTHFVKNSNLAAVMGRIKNSIPENPFAATQYAYYEKGLYEYFPARTPALLTHGRILDCEVMGIKKNVLLSLTPPRRHPRYRNDDVEIGVRLVASGHRIIFDPHIIAAATPRRTFMPLITTAFWNGFSDAETERYMHIALHEAPYRKWFLPWCIDTIRRSPYTRTKKLYFVLLLLIFPTVSRIGKVWYQLHTIL